MSHPKAPDLRALVQQARGGRVIRTGFLEGAALDRRALAASGIRFAAHGGFTDAERVIYTLYPEHIPNVDDPVRLMQITGDFDRDINETDIRIALGLPEDQLGDVRSNRDGFFIATTAKFEKQLETLTTLQLQGRLVEASISSARLEDLNPAHRAPKTTTRTVVVPSLRLDVVGAKGFGVSRAYFQAGIEGKKVRVNGNVASSSTPVRTGDTLTAEGIGRIEFKRIEGETRRGNIKLELEIHK